MQSIELLGYGASVASGGAFLPQAVRALRTRQSRYLSLASVALGAAGTVLRAGHGIAIGSDPVTVSNVIVMPFAIAKLVMKLRSSAKGGRCDVEGVGVCDAGDRISDI